MKKLNIVLAIFAIVFCLNFSLAQATSGACSYHGGVNCSAGASSSGNAICNDGWESSTSYYATNECFSEPSLSQLCPTPKLVGCTEDFEYTQFQDLCSQQQASNDKYCSGLATSYYRSGGTGTPPACNPPVSSVCSQATLCKAQIDMNKAAMQKQNQCVTDQTAAMEQRGEERIAAAEAALKASQDRLAQLNAQKTTPSVEQPIAPAPLPVKEMPVVAPKNIYTKAFQGSDVKINPPSSTPQASTVNEEKPSPVISTPPIHKNFFRKFVDFFAKIFY